MRIENERRVLEIGDKIKCGGILAEISKILSCDDWGGTDGIYCEFLDANGKYRYWKEGIDGGIVIPRKGGR